MLAINPQQIGVEIIEAEITAGQMAPDFIWRHIEPEATETVYTRMPKAFCDFLKTCDHDSNIVGFEYDRNSKEFGVIIKKESVDI